MQNTETEIKKTERLIKLATYQGEDRVVPAEELIRELESKNRTGLKLNSSIPTLDKLVEGFRKGNLVVLSAPTGHGKTTFFKTLTKNFTENGQKSIWFSYEVPADEFYATFPSGNKFFTMPRELSSGLLSWIEERILESKAKYNTNLVFIDHLHFLISMKELAITKNQSILIGMILRELKKIALANDMIIFLVAHMRKKDTEEEIPSIDDLRDSSFVAQEADVVMLLWRKQIERTREDKKNKVPPEWTNEAVLSVVKNRRTGKLGHLALEYNFNKNEFLEYSGFQV